MTPSLLFHEIVERHGPVVLRVCAAVVGPGPDAEDAWSETFLAALAAFPFEEVENIEAWLVRVARRKAIDVLRAQRRAVPTEDLRLELAEDSAESHDMAFTLDADLWAEVGTLSERQQFVIAHRYIAQWTYPEIAEKIGCSPAAARRAGADAVATLRRRIHPTENGDQA